VRSAQGALAAAHAAVQAPLRAAFRLLGAGPLALLDAVIFQLMSMHPGPVGAAPSPSWLGIVLAVAAACGAQARCKKGASSSRGLLVLLPLLTLLAIPQPADAVRLFVALL